MRTRLYVDDYGMSTGDQRRAVVRLKYGDKTVRIEFSRTNSFEREPSAESFGHALHELMNALSDWERSGGVIEWPTEIAPSQIWLSERSSS
jgi:hypothetical protein